MIFSVPMRRGLTQEAFGLFPPKWAVSLICSKTHQGDKADLFFSVEPESDRVLKIFKISLVAAHCL